MQLGIGTYSTMWSIGFKGAEPEQPVRHLDLLRIAGEHEVRRVQFGPNLPLSDLSPTDLARVCEDARYRELTLEVGMAGVNPEEVKRQVDLCHHTGSPFLRTVLAEEAIHVPSDYALETSLRTCEAICQDARIPLALENSIIPARTLRRILDSIGSPWLGVTLDTANSMAIGEGWREVVDALARYTICLHVKDFTVRRVWHRMGLTVQGSPAGSGCLNLPCIVDALRKEGRAKSCILELWVPEQERLEDTIRLEREWMDQSLTYLRKVLV